MGIQLNQGDVVKRRPECLDGKWVQRCTKHGQSPTQEFVAAVVVGNEIWLECMGGEPFVASKFELVRWGATVYYSNKALR